MKINQFARLIAVVLIAVICVVYANDVLKAKWVSGVSETYVAQEFYALKDNTIEVAVIGSSQVVRGINSMEMYEKYGISAFSVGTSNQAMLASYYWLKEMTARHKITTVVMDVSMLYENKLDQATIRRNLEWMKLSLNKIQAVRSSQKIITDEADGLSTYIFPFIKYHTRWTELEESDFTYKGNNDFVYRGCAAGAKIGAEDLTYEELIIDNDEPEDVTMSQVQKEWFDKIVEYCDEEDLNLLLIKTPKESWSLTRHEGVQALADEYGLDFLDFNTDELLTAIDLNMEQDLREPDHVNYRGADKMTDYISEFLLGKYDLTDYREVEGYEVQRLAEYQAYHQNCYLASSIEIADYVSYLEKDNYEAVIYNDTGEELELSESDIASLKEIGIDITAEELSENAHAYVVENGQAKEVKNNSKNEKTVSINGKFSSGVAYDITGKTAVTDESEVTYAQTGLHIMVYDKTTGAAADAVTFYNKDGSLAAKHIIVNDAEIEK